MNGTFSVPGNLSSGLYYILVTNGNAGNGTNNQIQLMSLVGSGTSVSSSNITINELTTAAAGTTLFNFGLMTASGGINAPANNAGASNVIARYNGLVTTGGSLNSSTGLGTTTTNALNTMANALASCVQTSGSCGSYFNAATNGSTAASSMMLAMYNTLNTSSNQTNIYNVAFPLAASTGFTMPSSTIPGGFTFNNALPATIGTLSSGGTRPTGIAIDASGNAWVANFGAGTGNTVTQLSPTGAVLGNFTVGTGPSSVAIDASANVWVLNGNSQTLTQLSSSGTTLNTVSVSHPSRFAIDASGNLWLANTAANVVTELSSSGSTVGTFSLPGAGGTITQSVAIDGAGNVWVTQKSGNNSVTELNNGGNLLGTFSTGTSPNGIAIDPSGNVWVSNNGSSNVSKFSNSGSALGTFSLAGPPEAGFAFDPAGNGWLSVGSAGDVTSTIVEMSSSGLVSGTYSPSGATRLQFLAIDQSGNVWDVNQGPLSSTTTAVYQIVGVSQGPQFFPYFGPIFP